MPKKIGELASSLVMEATAKAKTVGELHELLSGMAFAIGGSICFFDRDDRSEVMVALTQAMGLGLQATAKNIGEPSDMEIVVGRGEPGLA